MGITTLKISGTGSKTGAPSVNHHIKACPKAVEANCASFCYVNGTYVRHDKTVAADLYNLDLIQENLNNVIELARIFIASFKLAEVTNLRFFRFHERGDFITPEHFLAAMMACQAFPKTTFWMYTKSYHCIVGEIPDNVKIFISFSVNDTPLYRKRALEKAAQMGVNIAFASATRPTACTFASEIGLPMVSCPEQILKELKRQKKTTKTLSCIDCEICWKYPKRFMIWFQAHGTYRSSFIDWVPAKKAKKADKK